MKNILILGLILCNISIANAQTFNYQGALREHSGEVMSKQQMDLRITLLDSMGQTLYEEEHLGVQTNDAGIFNIKIGSIHPSDFEAISFDQPQEIVTEIKTTSGYEMIGRKALSAVPLAYHAKTVENADDADADPRNELQRLSFDATTNILSLSDGESIDLSSLDNDAGGSGTGTDDQKLSINGTNLSIEDGNSVNLSSLRDGVEDADADPANEIQRLSREGNLIKLSSDGGEVVDAVEDADADPANEIQKISLNKNSKKLSLSNGGGTVDLDNVISSESSPWIKNGDAISYDGKVMVDVIDIDGKLQVGENIEINGTGIKSLDAVAITSHPNATLFLNGGGGGQTQIGKEQDVLLVPGAGKVGIGPFHPESKLHVEGTGSLDGDGIVRIGTAGTFLIVTGFGVQRKNGPLALNPHGGNVGIGAFSPESKLHVQNGFSAGLTQKGYLMLGSVSGPNLVFDENEIQARNNGQPASLILNKSGGRLHCGGLRDIGNKYSMRYDIASGEIGYDNSSRRYKSNISSLHDDWKKILKARPVTYDRPASPGDWEYGYVAEEMDSIGLQNLVFYDAEGRPDNIDYARMVLYLTEVIKMHERDNLELRTRVEELEYIVKRKVLKIPH